MTRFPRLERLAARQRRSVQALLACLLLGWLAWRGFRWYVGSPAEELTNTAWTQAARVLARDGRLLGERPSSEGLYGVQTKLDDVSPRLVSATIASEDKRFFDHDGIDRIALARAGLSDLVHLHVVSGGSTITTQLVKRLDHQGRPRPRTIATKLVEMARAQNLERTTSKHTILEAYLNRLDYGRGLAGPEAAAQGYFGVPARDLSLAQSALLAVLPRAPSALDPYRHRERAVLRQRALLTEMNRRGLVSQEDLDRALSEPLVLRDPKLPRPFVAPHVVLANARRTPAGEIRTTLDFALQKDVEAIVRAHVPRLEQRGASTAAVVVVDNATGELLAEVGSAAFGDAKIAGAVDIVRAKRQPGSTLKPFVYARAFERGTSPMEMLADVPTEFGDARGHAYAPDNFDGTFLGPISAREALAGSLNVPAVRLAASLGAIELVSTLRASGLSLSAGAERYGLSIALGSGEVTPLELAEAYTTLARGGEHVVLHERAGQAAQTTHVFDASAVASVSDALSDPLARVRGLRTRGPFEFNYPVALKTGTSTAYRDAWTAGYTHERTVVVWVGNADGSATRKLTGAVGAGPLFFDVMKRAMNDVAVRAPLSEPGLLEDAEVCPLSGHRAGAACPDRVHRMFPRGHAPGHACTVHQMAASRTAPPNEPAYRCDAGGTVPVVVLPEAFERWLGERPLGSPGSDPHGIPWFPASRVPNCVAPGSEEPRIVVVEPRDGAVLSAERGALSTSDALDVAVETRGMPAGEPLEVLVDGRLAMRLDTAYRARVPVGRGDHLLEVRPVDARRGVQLGRAQISVR